MSEQGFALDRPAWEAARDAVKRVFPQAVAHRNGYGGMHIQSSLDRPFTIIGLTIGGEPGAWLDAALHLPEAQP